MPPYTNMVSVIEHSRVSPPPGTVSDKSLPLTTFDLAWVQFRIRHLLFYSFPNSKTNFVQTIIPRLKDSLSLTLQHYYPLAGNLIYPPQAASDELPEIRYLAGDSVALIFAESNGNFEHLAGDEGRNAEELGPLAPGLPSEGLELPIMAIQVTVFPHSGICFGYTISHVAGDASALLSFIKSWGLITLKSSGEDVLSSTSLTLPNHLVPFCDRTVVKDPSGLRIAEWNNKRKQILEVPQPSYTNSVRAAFTMERGKVEKLKELVLSHSEVQHISSFSVTCAYILSCIAKAKAACDGEDNNTGDPSDQEYVFFFGADGRSLMNPPLPSSYFGNCLVGCTAILKSSELVGEDGVVIAAKKIGETIQERRKMAKNQEELSTDFGILKGRHTVGVSSSPKFGIYDTDYGWGRPKKSEILSLINGSFSLQDSPGAKGDFEIGIAFPKPTMDAFASIFRSGLALPE